MSSTSNRRIEELFHRAADLPPGMRAEFLAQECGNDVALRESVEALLMHDAPETARSPLLSPLATHREQLEKKATPDQIGPYRITSVLGEGGMGTVYEAEQLRPVRRSVAVKVIKLGMDTREVIARFEAERQALAVMDHPGIARVYDAGSTDSGRPYFVMELVRGTPIARYCDDKQLSTCDRLGLFVRVCDAVQHAHTKGVIHRDLKPGNILVTEVDGVASPKVIDFGIVKATSSPLTDHTMQTEMGQMLGTPEYMSPEQARPGGAGDVDTRSDVYSLGAVLYELLTGSQPYDATSLRSGGYQEIARIIRDVDPPRPSTRIAKRTADGDRVAALRQETAASLSLRLRRELEWIPMMAMRKEREHRYRSAAELADDVRAYLAGRPLLAAPESTTYRTRKFLRRNRRSVSALAVMILLLIGGIVTTSLQAIRANREKARAEQRFNDVWALARGMLFDVQRDVSKLAGSQDATRQIVDLSKGYLEKLQAEKSTDVLLIADVASAYARLGDIQGSSNSVSSNDPQAARKSWERAMELANRALKLNPHEYRALRAAAEAEFCLGDAELSGGSFDVALKRFQRALELYTAAAAVAPPGSNARKHDVIATQTRIAAVRFRQSQITEAIDLQTRAVDDARKLLAAQPGDRDVQLVLATSLDDLSSYRDRAGDSAGAEQARGETIAAYESLFKADPNNSRFEKLLADNYVAAALSARGRGDHVAEKRFLSLAMGHARKLAAADSTSAHLQHLLATVLINDAETKIGEKEYAQAAQTLDEAINTYDKLLAANGADRQARLRLSVAYSLLSALLTEQAKYDQAIGAISRANEALVAQAKLDPGDTQLRAGIAYYAQVKAAIQVRAGRLDEAVDTYRGALSELERVVALAPDDSLNLHNELIVRRALGEVLGEIASRPQTESSRREPTRVEAIQLLTQARDGYAKIISSGHHTPEDAQQLDQLDREIRQLGTPSTQP